MGWRSRRGMVLGVVLGVAAALAGCLGAAEAVAAAGGVGGGLAPGAFPGGAAVRRLAASVAHGAAARRSLLEGPYATSRLTVAPLAGAPGSACASAPEEREALLEALDRLRESPVCAALFDSEHDSDGVSWGDAVSGAADAKSLAKARRQVQATKMAQQCSNPCLDDFARALFHAAFCTEEAPEAGAETVQAFEMQCVRNERGEFCMQAMAMVDESEDAAREEVADPCAQVRRAGCCFPTFLDFHGRLRGHLLHRQKSAGGAVGRDLAPEDLALEAEFGAASEFFSECGLTGSPLCPLEGKLNVTGFAREAAPNGLSEGGADGGGWSGGEISAADLEDPTRDASNMEYSGAPALASDGAPNPLGVSSGAVAGAPVGIAVALAAGAGAAIPALLAML